MSIVNSQIVIGIDPDSEKSGVGAINVPARQVIYMDSLPFPELVDYVVKTYSGQKVAGVNVSVMVEAGWLRKSNWHLHRNDTPALAAMKGNSTGRNHETGRKIVEMLRYKGIEVETVLPLRKCWKGKDGKITSEELSYIIGKKLPRCNQDVRDAVLLGWIYAGIPVKIHV